MYQIKIKMDIGVKVDENEENNGEMDGHED